jgi:hypothetical protein
MDQEVHPYEPLNASEPPVHQARRVPRVAVAVGITAFLGLAGAGVAVAVGGGSGAPAPSLSSSSPPSSTSPTVPGRPHPRAGFAAGGLGGNVLHGEYTIANGSSYQTVAVQVGQVTAVSSGSITVKSSDGYTHSYTVQPTTIVDSQSGGIAAVASKDTVRVQALVQGRSQIATNIVDTTKVGASRKGFGFGFGFGSGRPGGHGGGPGRNGPGGGPVGGSVGGAGGSTSAA